MLGGEWGAARSPAINLLVDQGCKFAKASGDDLEPFHARSEVFGVDLVDIDGWIGPPSLCQR